MRAFRLFFSKQVKKELIHEWGKACKYTNIIRDAKEKSLKKSFKYELDKKDEEILNLKELIRKNDIKNNKLEFNLAELRKILLEIESDVELKQVEDNRENQRRITLLNRSIANIINTEKKLPEIQKVSKKAMNEIVMTEGK